MPCKNCSNDPCICNKLGEAAIATLSSWLQRLGVPTDDLRIGGPPPPEMIIQLMTDPRSPIKMEDEDLLLFTRRLYELAIDAPRTQPSLEQVWDALGMDLAVAHVRVGEALSYAVEAIGDLVEGHPQISNHRAHIIDRMIRILAGDRYNALRAAAFGPDYNPGFPPAAAPNEAEAS